MKAKTKVTIKFYSRTVLGYAVLFTSIFAFGWLCSKLLETLFIVVGYSATRFLVPKIKHFDTAQKCISISTMTFMFAIAIICIPKNISVLWSIGVGAIIPIVMYIESLLFDPVVSEKEKLIQLCKEHNYNELKTQMAVKFFHDKEKPKDVWLWLCETQSQPIGWDTVKQTKYRMKKELFPK